MIGDIERLGLRAALQGPLSQIARHGRVPLLDHGTLRLIRQGHIEIVGDIATLDERSAHFSDGSSRPIDAIVAATGFPSVPEGLLEAAELPSPANKARRPGESGVRGLYFCGFAIPATGMFREIGIEAGWIAEHIARHSQHYARALSV